MLNISEEWVFFVEILPMQKKSFSILYNVMYSNVKCNVMEWNGMYKIYVGHFVHLHEHTLNKKLLSKESWLTLFSSGDGYWVLKSKTFFSNQHTQYLQGADWVWDVNDRHSTTGISLS